MATRAVILLSGGLDSATTGAIARDERFELYALTVDYGQRHHHELEAAWRVAQSLGVRNHYLQRIDLAAIGGSVLLAVESPTGASELTARVRQRAERVAPGAPHSDSAGARPAALAPATQHVEHVADSVPKDRTAEEMRSGIPETYVPARNTVLLALALAYAEVLGAADIFMGVNAVDYSGYPDCRPEFIAAFERLANLATKASVEGTLQFKIHAPLIALSKAEIIRRGMDLGVDYALTHSCYDPSESGVSCGRCDACQLRLEGFARAGLRDPLPYQSGGAT